MDFCLYVVVSLFAVLQANILAAPVAFRQNEYEALEPGYNITGSSTVLHEKISAIWCSTW